MKYPDSILQGDLDYCFICGKYGTEIHHVMNGVGLREKSTKYGLVVGLCREHHTGTDGVHHNPELAINLKSYAQKMFESNFDHDLWIKEFHKNYL